MFELKDKFVGLKESYTSLTGRFLHFILLNIRNSLWKYSLPVDQKSEKQHKANSVERTNYRNVPFGVPFIILLSQSPNILSGKSLQCSFIWRISEQQPVGCCHIIHVPTIFPEVVSYPLFYRKKECQREKKKRKMQAVAFAQ